MAERRTRGKASSIESLPEDIKQTLDKMLRNRNVTQQEIVTAINALLTEAGVQNEISKSALNRYATRMETMGARLRETREIASMWMSRLGDKPTGEVSNLLIETLQSIAFETTMHYAENPDGEPVSPEVIKELALGIARLEKAAEMSTKREKEWRREFAAEAAAATEKKLVSQGMSQTTIDTIKKEILGIA